MTQAHLRFATDILKRLGEELNPNLDQGILELVKNAYDADAHKCTVEMLSTHETEGSIRISDDGDGMDRNEIENGWLVLGRSSKSKNNLTRLGRSPVGNKGLGRLAALRMGSAASLVTRPLRELNNEYHLDIDWKKFDEAGVVDEVGLIIERKKRPSDSRNGTDILISGVRVRLSRVDVKRLARGLLLLADPFGDNPKGFQPVLKAPEFEDLEKLVRRRYFSEAEFHLKASVNEKGLAEALVTDWKGNELYKAAHKDLRPKLPDLPYGCPSATFDLWVFILNQANFTVRSVTLGAVREWLGEFGGVHLYIQGIRVAPYGNPGNDWLDMNLSRARNPEYRPSTNTSIGRIAVHDSKEEFLQKTDRAGLIEGETFQELRGFAIDALDWMARRRLDEREKRRAVQRSETPVKVARTRENLQQTIKDLPPAKQEKVRDQFNQYDRAREIEAQTLRKEVQLYRTLSTAGITAATFAHESVQPIRIIRDNIRLIALRTQKELGPKYKDMLEKPVDRITRQIETISAFGDLTLSFVDHEKRRTSRVDLHEVINNVLNIFDPFLRDRQVNSIPALAKAAPYLRGSEAAIESVITNLLVNSLKVFDRSPQGDRIIEIRTEVAENSFILRVLDNGTGIKDINVKDIWLPGETAYPNGTGLGLTIVRDTVRDLGGSVDAVAKGELGGAEIIIELPVIGA